MIPLRDANPTRRTPVVTVGLIVLCVVAFVIELGVLATDGSSGLTAFVVEHGVVPAELMGAVSGSGTPIGEAADIVTSMFLHAGWLHLAGNMLYLWIFGNNIEDRLGRLGFAAFYLAGGVAAALAQVAVDPRSEVPLVGASGAIAAILGAYLVLFPRARILSLVFLGFFYQLIAVPAVLVLGFWFILQVIDGVTSLGADTAEGGVAFFAHIGGFALGLVLGALIRRRGRLRGELGAGPGMG
ncbi:MAG TPA: rhomboid family intramembrane serine protease [Candidatus Limnocylindrales bacterium]